MTLQERDPMKPRTKKYLAFEVSQVLLGILAVLISSCSGPSAPERPRDPWVFRSVLDERPRMITMALHKNMWSAYDTQKCGLYKAWQGMALYTPLSMDHSPIVLEPLSWSILLVHPFGLWLNWEPLK